MGQSDTASWINVVDKAMGLGAQTILPGHGPVGNADVFGLQRRYLAEVRAQVGKAIAAGKSLDEAKATVDVPMWREWTGETKMATENIEHVYGELARAKAAAGAGAKAPAR